MIDTDLSKGPHFSPVGSAKLVLQILIWGVFGVIYNIYSKEALDILPEPITLGLLQLTVGSVIVLITWSISPPLIAMHDARSSVYIAVCHLFGSIGTLLSMHFSSVGFTHIVKAGEPIATAFFSYTLGSRRYSAKTYSTLLLIVAGIGVASANEMRFSLAGLISSSLAAIFYPLRIVLSKKIFDSSTSAVTARSLFRLITVLSTALAVPLLCFDANSVGGTTSMNSILSMTSNHKLLFLIIVSGASFHIYSEVSGILLNVIAVYSLI